MIVEQLWTDNPLRNFNYLIACRETGDALVRRKLYTDSDLSVVRYRRVLIVNGIDIGAIRGDPAERDLSGGVGQADFRPALAKRKVRVL